MLSTEVLKHNLLHWQHLYRVNKSQNRNLALENMCLFYTEIVSSDRSRDASVDIFGSDPHQLPLGIVVLAALYETTGTEETYVLIQ